MKAKEIINYQDYNQKIISLIEVFNENGKLIKGTQYHSDGKTIEYILEFDEKTTTTKLTQYHSDGKTIKTIGKFDKNNKLIKRIHYNNDGTIDSIEDFNTTNKN